MIRAEHLEQTYRSGNHPLTVLHDINLTVEPGAFVAIVGPSGSGKTTLLGLLAGLDQPTAGRVVLDGVDLATISEDERAGFRAARVGFVFQSFQLIPTLTALENVLVPLELRGRTRASDRTAASVLLARVGLADRMDHYPQQLSGGEQQRVGLARAFVAQPRLLFADEPTGSLDADTGRAIIDLLYALNHESGTTMVLVTHDPALALRATRVIRLAAGRIVADGPP
jgi:putative ABC transport system ATP-binding protein